jgi:hypothetical protein
VFVCVTHKCAKISSMGSCSLCNNWVSSMMSSGGIIYLMSGVDSAAASFHSAMYICSNNWLCGWMLHTMLFFMSNSISFNFFRRVNLTCSSFSVSFVWRFIIICCCNCSGIIFPPAQTLSSDYTIGYIASCSSLLFFLSAIPCCVRCCSALNV